MKFGKQIKKLADPTHLNHYIAYDVLKKAIGVVVPDGPKEGGASDMRADIAAVTEEFGDQTGQLSAATRPADSRFHHLLQHELGKVNRFASLQLRTLLDTLREAQRPLLQTTGAPSAADLAAAEKLLDQAAEELVQLEQFRRMNFTGFRKIVKKFDKRCEQVGTGSTNLESWFVLQLQREFFIATPLDSHMLSLAWGYAALRRFRRGGAAPPPAPASAATTTSSYLLVDTERMRALCCLLKRFDVVLPPQESPFVHPEGGRAELQQQQKLLNSMVPDGIGKQNIALSAETTLTYLDGVDFPSYKDRLGKGPSGFRIRRTASEAVSMSGGGGLVERDGAASALGVHAFTPVKVLQSPDAFQLTPNSGEAFEDINQLRFAAASVIAGQGMQEAASLGDDGCKQLQAFGKEVNARLDSLDPDGRVGSIKVAATVRSDRVLLRGDSSSTEGARIAVDKDLQFSLAPAGRDSDDAVDFPYCLLEVASGAGDASDEWLEELRSYGVMHSVEGFSIGTHAVAVLHQADVQQPSWYQNLTSMETTLSPDNFGHLMEVRKTITANTPAAVPAHPATSPTRGSEPPAPASLAGPPVPRVPEQNLEPKDFLASERTYLEWVNTTVVLAVMGIGLWKYSLSFGTGKGEPVFGGLLNNYSAASYTLGCYSLFMVAVALAFLWYSAVTHLSRVKAIQGGKATENVFNSPNAPVVFALAVVVTLVTQMTVKAVPLFTAIMNQD